jgi:8-oxo-dGTP pyrophosphatase MutT (NUDIX family)
LTVYPDNAPIRSLRKQIATVIRSLRLFPLLDQVISEVKRVGEPTNVNDVLQNRALANIVAVSVLIVDREGKIGIVKRTKEVAISSGSYGMACAGTVNEADFASDDPFLSCVCRELQEECNLTVVPDDIQFDGIVVPTQKMQPIFLYRVELAQTWEERFPSMLAAKDYAFETDSLYAVPVAESVRFAAQARMTDTAAYHIWHYAQRQGHQQNWYLEMLRPLHKRKFVVKN